MWARGDLGHGHGSDPEGVLHREETLRTDIAPQNVRSLGRMLERAEIEAASLADVPIGVPVSRTKLGHQCHPGARGTYESPTLFFDKISNFRNR